MMKKFLPLSLLCLLSACSTLGFGDDKEKSKLEGERLSLYDFEKTLQQDPNTKFGMDGNEAQSIIRLPDALKGGADKEINIVAPWENSFWPQAGGYPNHAMKHIAFTDQQPKRQWSSSIGQGSNKRHPLTAVPIMADDMVFTLNTEAEIYAFDAKSGKKLWDTDTLKSSKAEPVIGGGIAYSGGKLFATNGFNELLALNPKNGEILWRVGTKSPVRAAPSAILDRVFVTTLENETLAFDTAEGKKLWSHRGLSSDAGILGSSTPAITRDAVISAYSSGEVYALQIDTGTELWSENLSPIARAAGQSALNDISALPVVDEGIVYAASYSNRMSAIDVRTGQTKWQIPVGTASTPWVSGNRTYVIESQGTLMSVNNTNGGIQWQTALPRFEDVKDREGLILWRGPMLAGGRLMVFGSHGMAMEINPVDGAIIREWSIGDDIMLAPAIAKGTLYLVSNDGSLSAWR